MPVYEGYEGVFGNLLKLSDSSGFFALNLTVKQFRITNLLNSKTSL